MPVSGAGQPALVLDLQAVGQPVVAGTTRIRPSCSARPMNGRTVSDTSVAATLTANGTKSPASARKTCSAMVTPALSWASSVDAPRCGSHHDRGQLEQRRLGASAPWRTRRARPRPRCRRGWPRPAPPRRRCRPRAVLMMRMPGLGLGQQVPPDEAERSRRSSAVDGDEVGLGHQLLEAHQLAPPCAWPARPRRTGRRPTRRMPKAQGPLGHQGSRPGPRPTTPRVLPCSSTPSHFERSHLPGHQGGVGLGDVAGLGQQQGHGLLGGRQDVGLRGVDHHHAPLGGRGDVDVVEADAGPADHDQVGARRQDLGGHRVAERMISAWAPDDGRRPAPRGTAPAHVHLVAGSAMQVEPGLGQLFGDQYPATWWSPSLPDRCGALACRICVEPSRAPGEPRHQPALGEQLGQPGHPFDQVVVAQGVGHPEVARRAERLARAPPPPWPPRWPELGQFGAASPDVGPGGRARAAPRPRGRRRTRPRAARHSTPSISLSIGGWSSAPAVEGLRASSATAAQVARHGGQRRPLGHVGHVGRLVATGCWWPRVMTSAGPIIHPTRQPVMA